jgi:hypothetical protein
MNKLTLTNQEKALLQEIVDCVATSPLCHSRFKYSRQLLQSKFSQSGNIIILTNEERLKLIEILEFVLFCPTSLNQCHDELTEKVMFQQLGLSKSDYAYL